MNSGGVEGEALRGEKDRPRHMGNFAPELTVDKIGDATEEESGRCDRDDEICRFEESGLHLPGDEECGRYAAGEATVTGHSPLPELEKRERIAEKVGEVVEKHEAEPAPDHCSQGQIDDGINLVLGIPG